MSATGEVTFANTLFDLGYRTISKSDGANYSFGAVFGNDSGYTFNDDGFGGTLGQAAALANSFIYDGTKNGQGLNVTSIVGRNSSHVKPAEDAAARIQGNDYLGWKNTSVGRTETAQADEAASPWIPCASYVPSQWPDFQPCTLSGDVDDFEVDQIIGKTKVAEYMKYLANVRSLPIGVMGNTTTTSYCEPTAILPVATSAIVNGPSCNYTEYRVSMPFLSGIYGILADKMFPDLLIGANNIRIEFKLASNTKALWLTMDPCRRVPGTVRDWAPFTGAANGAPRGGTISGLTTTAGASGGICAAILADAALGCSSAMLNCQNNNSAAPLGLANYYRNTTLLANPTAEVLALNSGKIIPNSYVYNTSSAMGEDLKGSQTNVVPLTALNAWTTGQIATNFNNPALHGFDLDTMTRLPKPQYMPVAQPWLQKSFYTAGASVSAAYVNENAACFGTYLPASRPQTRRCQLSSRLAIVDPIFSSAGVTAFAIRDLQYIGEQVQLDDISTSAIIQHAATSEIVVWTRGYRSFEANCDSNTQQNIILPIQIGQATALYLVFRPAAQLLSQDYYSNSFCCPFTGLSYSQSASPSASIALGKAGKVPDVGGNYTLATSLDTQNMGKFSYQLFSGTKQYPLQPIQTVSEMLVEREKSVHSLHNWSWCSTENMNLTCWDSQENAANGLNFDPFLDLGFFTTFVPVAALDDQTITQNPYFSIAETTEVGAVKPRIRGIRQSAYSTAVVSPNTTTFVGVLNHYIPPIGTFYLGWDFESWTNHDDLMRTGKFLGQEQLSIRMTGCQLMAATNPIGPNSLQSVSQNVGCTAIVPHVVKLSFVPGGHMLSYY